MDNYDSSETEAHISGDPAAIDYDINRDLLFMGRKHAVDDDHVSGLSGKHSAEIPENDVGVVVMFGTPIISLYVEGKERLCLAQISNTLLRQFSYNEIHNRRVALGITCMQCTPIQLEILRRLGAMPVSSRRCGLITRREAERLVKSFLEDNSPPTLPDNFYFKVYHKCGWGSQGHFIPTRYNSSRAKCIKCIYCNVFFSPNKFIFHFHRLPNTVYRHADAANFNSWRKHLHLAEPLPSEDIIHAWEDVKAMFNGGSRKRLGGTLQLDPKTKSKDVGFVPYSQKENSGDVDVPISLAERFHTAPSYPVNPVYNTAASSLLTRTHPAFPKPRVPTSYGDFFRSLSAPYSMWWMKYAPLSAGYNINQLPRPPLEIPGMSQPWLPNLKNIPDLNISPDVNSKTPLKYNPCDYGDQWNWYGLMPNHFQTQHAANSFDRPDLESNICSMKKHYDDEINVTSNTCKHQPSHSNNSNNSNNSNSSSSSSSNAPNTDDRKILSVHHDDLNSDNCSYFDENETEVSSPKYSRRDSDHVNIRSSFSPVGEPAQHLTNQKEPKKGAFTLKANILATDEESLSDGELEKMIPENIQLEQISIDNLRKMLTKAKKLRKRAEKDKKKIQDSFDEQNMKHGEFREKMIKESENIKAEYATMIQEERSTSLVMEEKLKESRNALNEIYSKMSLNQRCSEVKTAEHNSSTNVNLA
ncbi:uncharacterized protein LOC115229583 [Octopus sinensis]|uniref:Uncharacterized protein LOC115229583 n=1 Tax=Octopus sinensis TaxID=2607531 RepID=A0A6P7TVU3_9MOLL|nr:uncharacterized protein LOC115229583 [Octopus sinensis]